MNWAGKAALECCASRATADPDEATRASATLAGHAPLCLHVPVVLVFVSAVDLVYVSLPIWGASYALVVIYTGLWVRGVVLVVKMSARDVCLGSDARL